MTGSGKNTPTLSPAEWEVMKVLWDNGELAARDVYAKLPDNSEWAYKTVKTLLSRLVAKGAIEYDQIGNSYLYRTAVARDELSRVEIKTVFSRIMSEAFSPVLSHFIEEADLTDEEIKELQNKLKEKRKKKSPAKNKRRR